MFRYVLPVLAALVLVTASLIPDDAFRAVGVAAGIEAVEASTAAPPEWEAFEVGPFTRVAWAVGTGRVRLPGRYYPRRGYGAAAVGAAAVGAAAAGAYGAYGAYNNCYDAYGNYICGQQYRY